jgi:formylglycine-generating enzyme required for sulfatase activity
MKIFLLWCAATLIAATVAAAQVSKKHAAPKRIAGEPEMVFVKGGTFTMGCIAEQGSGCYNSEKPAHSVTLSDFSIGKYEVTQAQWLAVMGGWPGRWNVPDTAHGLGDSYPAYYVSWEDVQRFIDVFNKKTGKRYRLPTEAEWEYAARGGQQAHGYSYSGSNTVGGVAWYSENAGYATQAVGTKQPNELGIYDMSGNVWEWCSDWYGSYSSGAQTNPTGPATGFDRVNRGGCWNGDGTSCRVAYRSCNYPRYCNNYIGFRLVLP